MYYPLSSSLIKMEYIQSGHVCMCLKKICNRATLLSALLFFLLGMKTGEYRSTLMSTSTMPIDCFPPNPTHNQTQSGCGTSTNTTCLLLPTQFMSNRALRCWIVRRGAHSNQHVPHFTRSLLTFSESSCEISQVLLRMYCFIAHATCIEINKYLLSHCFWLKINIGAWVTMSFCSGTPAFQTRIYFNPFPFL